MHKARLFIGGEWQDAASGSTYQTINPADESVSAEVAEGAEADVDRAVRAARAAFASPAWAGMPAAERGKAIWRLGDLVDQHADELARLETLNTGKTWFDSRKVEIPMAASVLRYFAGCATKLHGRTVPVQDAAFTFTLKEPVGVVGAIVPWNFPLLLAMWKIAPALAAGCTLVVKPATITPLSVLRFAELAVEAGIPPGVLNVVPGKGGAAGMALVRHPLVDKIAFTGSTAVGKEIQRECAATVKRLSLELGGKSPNIVFADADLDAAAKGALTGIFYNKGEVCAAGSRLLVEQSVHDEMLDRLRTMASSLKVGDPMEKGVRMGPVASKAQMEAVLGYVEKGKAEGARLVTGGSRIDVGTGKGFYVAPTVFDRVEPRMAIAREEIFGPVLSVLSFQDLDGALQTGNDTPYGLAAAVWTRDVSRALRAARALKAGTVWVNTYNLYDPALPFGGYKESGFGREMGVEALEGYMETKSVWVHLGR